MAYSVESINGCTKKLVFTFDKLDLSEQIKAAVKQKQKSVNIKGFRKGKAPLDMVEKVYGPQIESDALNRFVQQELFQAVTEEKLRVVGYPNFENINYEAGKSVSFDALVEIFPEVKLKEMKGLSFSKDAVTVTDEEVENVKKNYLNSRAEMKEVSDAKVKLAKGQFAVFNFQGEKEDGERPENMKGEEFLLEIGSGQFIPGFEDGMIGMKKGEKKDINLTFPADYHVADLKDAKVKFEVELLEIKEKAFPEFSDELAKEFGFESAADFTAKTKENLTSQKEKQASEKLNQEILEKLIAENTFDVPAALVAQQEQYLREDLTRTLKSQGFNDSMVGEYFNKWAGDLSEKATFQVKSGLILDNLANEFKVEATEADFNAKVEESAKLSGLELEQVKKYYSDAKIKQNLMYAIREEKTFDMIKAKVTVK
ncbi:trigger factor [Bacteriovorax sp. BSW11_IV]|uniref:trigger factor n=1 Tax=Bacteriovorax sp. BSW11_IV TaxID=1353529 RepID=UPI00038A28A6|nr:trigger factor [Bacteriovorax sp. BSW11_IV]EQC44434.1 trigger factor [Bacteriovorax sp. BSW11_IV]